MLFYLSLVSCGFYFIKLYNQEKYVTGAESELVKPFLGSREIAQVFELKISKKDIRKMEIWLLGTRELVWDIAEGKTDLIYFPYHGLSNQNATLIPVNASGLFLIEFGGKCVSYIKANDAFERKLCDNDDTSQVFEFVNIDRPDCCQSCEKDNDTGSGSFSFECKLSTNKF